MHAYRTTLLLSGATNQSASARAALTETKCRLSPGGREADDETPFPGRRCGSIQVSHPRAHIQAQTVILFGGQAGSGDEPQSDQSTAATEGAEPKMPKSGAPNSSHNAKHCGTAVTNTQTSRQTRARIRRRPRTFGKHRAAQETWAQSRWLSVLRQSPPPTNIYTGGIAATTTPNPLSPRLQGRPASQARTPPRNSQGQGERDSQPRRRAAAAGPAYWARHDPRKTTAPTTTRGWVGVSS